jgi:site-specific DNA recombinase
MARAINAADAIRECYDDGAFRWKVDHVYARRIDVIVVYKVDRLTCALAEFARLSSWSSRTALSSFSVTHAFNTTMSMGR